MSFAENKKTKHKIYAFDTFRFLLACCVLWGHSYIILFKGDSHIVYCIQNLAVDGFFILSGFLSASSYYNSIDTNNTDVLVIKSIINKIKRLYPEYVFALLITLILSCVFFHKPHIIDILMNLVFMGQINGSEGIIMGGWYVSVLFWLSVLFIGLLYYCRNKAIYCIIPLMSFGAFSYCYAIYGGLSLNSFPLIDGYISAGFLKGIMGMGGGICTFFVCLYIQNTSFLSDLRYPSFYIFFIETLCLYLLCYSFIQEQFSKRDFICYFAYPFLIGIYYFNKAIVTKFFSLKIWRFITPSAYMLFLTPCILLEMVKKYLPYQNFSRPVFYTLLILFCCSFALFCYHMQKWLFSKLKQILFISQASQSTQTTEILDGDALAGQLTPFNNSSNVL